MCRIRLDTGDENMLIHIFITDFFLIQCQSFFFQYYEMSYGLNVEMHKQTEICKRLDAIIRQVLPFLSGEVGPVLIRWSFVTLLIKVTCMERSLLIQIGHILCLLNPRLLILTWSIVSASTTSGSCSGTRQADHHGGVERGDAGSSLTWFIKLERGTTFI